LEIEYQDFLHHRLRELGATRLNYEGIGLENLIHRALGRRKPFDSKGRSGFRDAVLWETILKKAQEQSEQIVFVTRNAQDFGDHGQLAKDLQEDLRRLGLSDERVKVCGGLALFAKEYASGLERRGASGVGRGPEPPCFGPERFFREAEDGIYAELNSVAEDRLREHEDIDLTGLRPCPDETSVHHIWRLKDDRCTAHVSYVVQGTVSYRSKGDYDWERLLRRRYVERRVRFWIYLAVEFEESTGNTLQWKTQEVRLRLSKKREVDRR